MEGDSGIQCPGLEVGQVKWWFLLEAGFRRKVIGKWEHALHWALLPLGLAGLSGIRPGENEAKMGRLDGKWGGTCWTDDGYPRQDESKKMQIQKMEGMAP